MTEYLVNWHTFPGRGDPAKPSSLTAERLGIRPGLVLVAAAERYAVPERWGLGVALRFSGASVTSVSLVVEDDLCTRDPETLQALTKWAMGTFFRSPGRPRRVEVIARRDLTDPDVGEFTTTAYTGAGWFFTADGGRSLALLADYWTAARIPFFSGGFMLGIAGWGTIGDEEGQHGGWRAKLNRPPVYAKSLGAHGLVAQFGKAGWGGYVPQSQTGLPKKRAGRWERQPDGRSFPFRGRMVDLVGPAHAFDGIDTSDLGDHLAAFGMPALSVPSAVEVGGEAASYLLAVAHAIHALAFRLDAEAAEWLTSPSQRADAVTRVRLASMYSPGSLANAALWATGLTPPLERFGDLDDEFLDRWSAASHGGWVS